MFHNVHSYIASKLYSSEDDLLLVGSILPDLALTKVFGWAEGGLHGIEEDLSFQKFIQKNYPEYIDLARGVNAHNILDDFTHLDYNGPPGYAFRDNEELTKLVMDYYKIEEEAAKGKAHNYIESAVDILLLQKYPEIQKSLKSAILRLDKEWLANILAKHFKSTSADMLIALSEYLALFTKYDFSEKENWNFLWKELEPILALKDIGGEKRDILLEASLKVVGSTYLKFLEYAITKGQNKTNLLSTPSIAKSFKLG